MLESAKRVVRARLKIPDLRELMCYHIQLFNAIGLLYVEYIRRSVS